MIAHTFRGGVHPLHRAHEGKPMTADRPIERIPVPDRLVVSMLQHLGAPCEPLVRKGDSVYKGQLIGKPVGLGANIHATVSGTVAAVEPVPHPSGSPQMAVILQNDGMETWDPMLQAYRDPAQHTPEEIRSIIQQAGIVGMGGAAFPSFIKIPNKPGVSVDTLIINAAECEPYLTADTRLIIENPDSVLDGVRWLLGALPGARGVLGIEDNKKEAIGILQSALNKGNYKNITIEVLPTKYPQGSEKHLIYAITGREVPYGKLPADVGCVVFNAATASAVSTAVRKGYPLVERVVTVTGPGIQTPSNLLARIGTPVQALIEHCGGFQGRPGKVISGGPMMGVTLVDLSIPVMKGMSGILVLPDTQTKEKEPGACIRCARCAGVCPMRLQPLYISGYVLKRNFDKAEQFGAMDCIECGACSYICPANRPLTPCCRIAKKEIRELSQRRAQLRANKEGA